jgi:hypothetical protein
MGDGSGLGSGTGTGGDGGAVLVAGIGSVIGQIFSLAARSAASLLFKKTSDIVAPRGKVIGYKNKGAREDIRTVSKKEFDKIEAELRKGAKIQPKRGDYDGTIFKRNDETIFGIRNSDDYGRTIDLFNNSGI